VATYQNIFTQVQLSHAPEMGIAMKPGSDPRGTSASFNHLFGRVGQAQIGPVYLGWTGLLSILCGLTAFEIIGLNMMASVNWDPIQFVRMLPWLSLEPPGPEYGFSPIVPLAKGGWWIMAGAFLTLSVLLWAVRTYRRAEALGMGKHVFWAFMSAIWLFLVLGFIRPAFMGSWSEAVPFGISIGLPRFRSAMATCSTIRSTPFRSPSSMARPCSSRCTVRPSWQSAAMAGSGRSSRSPTAVPHRSALPCSGAGPWASTPRWNRSTAGPGGLPF
jgi:hypothetical protein